MEASYLPPHPQGRAKQRPSPPSRVPWDPGRLRWLRGERPRQPHLQTSLGSCQRAESARIWPHPLARPGHRLPSCSWERGTPPPPHPTSPCPHTPAARQSSSPLPQRWARRRRKLNVSQGLSPAGATTHPWLQPYGGGIGVSGTEQEPRRKRDLGLSGASAISREGTHCVLGNRQQHAGGSESWLPGQ